MELKSPRPPRYSLRIAVEITDQLSGRTIVGETSDVSLAGCYVIASETGDFRSTVRIRLGFESETVTAHGDVVRTDPNKGIGIRFRAIAPDQMAILKRWLFVADRADQ